MSDLERDLENELHRVLDPLAAVPVPPRRTGSSHGPAKTLLGGAGAAVAAKVLTGVVAAAAFATVAGAVTETAVTRSLNPADWARQVRHQAVSHGDQQPAPAEQPSHPVAGATSSGSANGSSNGPTSSEGPTNSGGPNSSGQDWQPPNSRDDREPTDPARPAQNPNHISPRP